MSTLIILQVLFVAALVGTLNRYGPYMYMASMAVTVVTVLYIFNSDSDPSVKLSWLLFVAVGSPFGALFYVYVRSDAGHRRLKKQMSRILKYTSRAQPETPLVMEAIGGRRPERAPFVHYLNDVCGYHPYPASDLKYYPLGEDFLPDFLEDLASAEDFIFLEYFIVTEGQMWGKILYILSEKAREGVEVRLIYDGTNEFANLPHSYPEMLKGLGIACRIFDPVTPFVSTEYNYRDHRKIAVIDGKIAYTGGLNLSDEYINVTHPFGHWKDVAIRTHGDGVATFTRLFLETWNYRADRPIPSENRYIEASARYGLRQTEGGRRTIQNGFIIPYADNPLDGERMGEQVYLDILQTASDYVYIMTPYLILDETMVNAMTYAAKRGVDVRIILPHIPDKRYAFALAKSHYPELLAAGVSIYEYTPGFVHAKVFLSDGCRATVGSINLDYRSLYHHFEAGLYIDGNRVIDRIALDFRMTLDRCQQISLEDTRGGGIRNRLDRAFGAVLKLLAPML